MQWMGKPIDSLTREELLDIVRYYSELFKEVQSPEVSMVIGNVKAKAKIKEWRQQNR